ncbi:MAG TPA: class I SAM-dependent methyltransferase [Acidimicrobiia bacterium]|nr:class I SAM-dependent methyltransferase [Acidimicrobiia bacterium]
MTLKHVANVEMAAAWDGEEGEDWARDWERYDRAVARYHGRLLEAAAVGVADRVLDVGCGNGQVTRDAARAASSGSARGVDLSSRMLERARALAEAEGVANAVFEQADAQIEPFAAGAYDLVLSRFGTMFFSDRVAAFTNLAGALRPGGGLAMVVWRAFADNEWLRCIVDALAAGRDLPTPPPDTPGPFGLADPEAIRATLGASGFRAVEITAVDEEVWVGADADDAFAFFRRSGVGRGLTQELDDEHKARAFDALRATVSDHDTGDGVRFGSAAWLVTARRAAG